MKHVIFYSGGIGSWYTALRVITKYGKENTHLLFTDTLIEDDDLYRFIIETTNSLYGIENDKLLSKTKNIPGINRMSARKKYLRKLAIAANKVNSNLHWIMDGRTPFETFKDARFLGNSRLAPCSHILKQKTAKLWVDEYCDPDDTILYMGIDWSEEHRTKAPTKNWYPFKVKFPMCAAPFLSKQDMIDKLNELDIETPELYQLGFSHNNCGGFCCRAGQGHFIKLLEQKPERYAHYEQKEKEMREYLEKEVSMIKRTKRHHTNYEPLGKSVEEIEGIYDTEHWTDEQWGKALNGERVTKTINIPLTLRDLRLEHQSKNESCEIDYNDMGGCGCFVDEVD